MGADYGDLTDEALAVHYGYREGGEGFVLIQNKKKWSDLELQDAKKLASLRPEASDSKELIRFWGNFHGHAIAVKYQPLIGRGFRVGAFDVRIWAADSSSSAPDPQLLLSGKSARFDRSGWLGRFAKAPAEQRRRWLMACFKALHGQRAQGSLESWTVLEQFSLALALFPWPMVRVIDFTSTDHMGALGESQSQFVVKDVPDSDVPPPWAQKLYDRIERGILEQPDAYADVLARIDATPSFRGLKRFFDIIGIWLEPPISSTDFVHQIDAVISDKDLPEDFRYAVSERAVAPWVRRDGENLVNVLNRMVHDWRSSNINLCDRVFGRLASEFSMVDAPNWDTWELLYSLRQSGLANSAGEGALALRRWLCVSANQKPDVDSQGVSEWVTLLEDLSSQIGDLDQVGHRVLVRLWREIQLASFWERRSLLRLRKRMSRLRGFDLGVADLRAAMFVDEKALSIAYRMVRGINAAEAPTFAIRTVLEHGGKHCEALLMSMWSAFDLAGQRWTSRFLASVRANIWADDDRSRMVFCTLWDHLVQEVGDEKNVRNARIAWQSMKKPSIRELEQRTPPLFKASRGVWIRLRWIILVLSWTSLGIMVWWRLQPESFNSSRGALIQTCRQAWDWILQVSNNLLK